MSNDPDPVRRFPRWLETFIPTKEVSVTPILISANVLVWIAMIATGVSPYMPSVEDVMKWGANNSDAIGEGEYWRLWTSNYLHYGFLHLGVNMLSLNNVGRLLERFIGKWRFALLYTVTGIFASAVSIWWNPFGVGVGASGAILGIVGVLTAILTTNLIDKSVRMQMLRSIGFSIVLMLLIGMNAGIDNAAHLGGLVSGAIGGYFIYPELKAFYYERKINYLGLIASMLLIAGGTIFFVMKGGTTRSIDDIFRDAQMNEVTAESNFSERTYSSSSEVKLNVISVYELSLRQFDSIIDVGLNEEGTKEIDKHRNYIRARIKYYEYIGRSLDTQDSIYLDSINIWRQKSERLRPIILTGQ